MRRLRSVEKWLAEVVDTYQDSRSRPRRRFGNLIWLPAPTQISGVFLRHGGYRVGVLALTHEENQPNRQVTVVQLSSLAELAKFADEADRYFGTDGIEIDTHPMMKRFVKKEIRFLGSACVQLADWVHRGGMGRTDRAGAHLSGQMIMSARSPGAYWQIALRGELPNPREFLKAISKPHRRTPRSERPTRTKPRAPPPTADEIEIYAAHHEPPLWFGDPPFRTLSDEILQRPVHLASKRRVIATGVVSGTSVCVYNDALLVAFTQDRRSAREIINQVFSVLARAGIPSLAVPDLELLTVQKFDPLRGTLLGSSSTVCARNELYILPPRGLQPPVTCYSVPQSVASASIEQAHNCSRSSKLWTSSLRAYDALTLFRRGSFTEAFLVGWALIESVIQKDFGAYWSNRGTSKTKIKDMDSDWKVSQKIDLLYAVGDVKAADFRQLHRLRKIRNKVVHEMKEASEADSEACLSVALSVLSLPSIDSQAPKMAIL